MRTTLTLDDDVFTAAKAIAAHQRRPIGEVLSALARTALQPVASGLETRNGVPLLPSRPGALPVTLDLVNQLRDETS